MRLLMSVLLLCATSVAQPAPQTAIAAEDGTRIREFYRLAGQIQDSLWKDWSKIPDPLLLVTSDTEYLTHHSAPPKDFTRLDTDFLARPRQFPTGLLATFPAFGPPSVIVIGQPKNTEAKTSTPWVIIAMHEHFHQMQDAQPGVFEKLAALNLAKGDRSGMWQLNYAFPYDDPKVGAAFGHARDALLTALETTDDTKFRTAAAEYLKARKQFFDSVSEDDRKYLNFQLWKEGIARYTQVKAAEAAATYNPSGEFKALADYEPFADYAKHARRSTLDELRTAELAKMHRVVVYSYGAAEGFLLDRLHPGWHDEYFQHLLTLEPLFSSK